MDKNNINIDDLFRQRLGNAEEEQRPGAWLNMKALLDEQMPVQKTAAVNWRRMFGYVAGLALLAAISVGSYEAINHFSSADEAIADNTNGSVNSNRGVAGTALNTLPDTRKESVEEPEASNSPVASSTTESTTEVTKAGVSTTNSSSSTAASNSAPSTVNSGNSINNTKPTVAKNSKVVNNVANNTATSSATNNNNAADAVDTKSLSSKLTVAASSNRSTSTAQQQAAMKNVSSSSSNNKAQENVSAQLSASSAKNTNSTQVSTVKAKAQQSQPALATGSAEKLATSTQKPEFEVEQVPVTKIVRNESYDKDGSLKMDTIFNGEDIIEVRRPKQEKESLVLANNKNASSRLTSNMEPNAATTSKAGVDEEVEMIPLSSKLVKRKKQKNFSSTRFEEMVKNAKYRLSNVRFYPGIVIGANAAFNGNFGMQGGLAMNMTITDRWSILTEAKYIYNFNGKTNFSDNYINNFEDKYVGGQKITTYDSVEYLYNFNSYSRVELPIAVNYSFQRFDVFGGANLAYNFKINNVADVEYKHEGLTTSTNTNTNIYANQSSKSVLLSDFKPSFNVGYVLGIGYHVTPGSRVDLRISQPVWNNANTLGAKEIQKRLYNVPTVQFNYIYRFSSNKPYKKAR